MIKVPTGTPPSKPSTPDRSQKRFPVVQTKDLALEDDDTYYRRSYEPNWRSRTTVSPIIDVTITSPNHFDREQMARSQLESFQGRVVEEVDQGRAPTPHSAMDGSLDIPGFHRSSTPQVHGESGKVPLSLAAELKDIERASQQLLQNMELMELRASRSAHDLGSQDVQRKEQVEAKRKAKYTETGVPKGIGSRTAQRAAARKEWKEKVGKSIPFRQRPQSAFRPNSRPASQATRSSERQSQGSQNKKIISRDAMISDDNKENQNRKQRTTAVANEKAENRRSQSPAHKPYIHKSRTNTQTKRLSGHTLLEKEINRNNSQLALGSRSRSSSPGKQQQRIEPSAMASAVHNFKDPFHESPKTHGYMVEAELARLRSELEALQSVSTVQANLKTAKSETLDLLDQFPQFTDAIKSMEEDTSDATRALHDRIASLVQSYRHMNELVVRAPLGFISSEMAKSEEKAKPIWMPHREDFDHTLLQAEAQDIAFRKRQIDAMLQESHQPVFDPFSFTTDGELVQTIREKIRQIDADIIAFVEDSFAFRARKAKDEARSDARHRASRRQPMFAPDKENTAISTFEPIAPWMGPEAWARMRHPLDAKEPPKPPKILQTKMRKPHVRFAKSASSVPIKPYEEHGTFAKDDDQGFVATVEHHLNTNSDEPPSEQAFVQEPTVKIPRQPTARERVRKREEEAEERRRRAAASAKQRARERAQAAAKIAKNRESSLRPMNPETRLGKHQPDVTQDHTPSGDDDVQEISTILDALDDRRHTQAAFEASERAAQNTLGTRLRDGLLDSEKGAQGDEPTFGNIDAISLVSNVSYKEEIQNTDKPEPEPEKIALPGSIITKMVTRFCETLGKRKQFAMGFSYDAVGSLLAQCQQGVNADRDLWVQSLAVAQANFLQMMFAYRIGLQEACFENLLDEGVPVEKITQLLTIGEQFFSAIDVNCISLQKDEQAAILALAHQHISASSIPTSGKMALTSLLGRVDFLATASGIEAFSSAVRAAQGVQLAMLGHNIDARARASIQAASAVFTQSPVIAKASAADLAAAMAAVQGTALILARGDAPLGDLEISSLASAISFHCAKNGYPLQEAGQTAVRVTLSESLRAHQQVLQALKDASRHLEAERASSAAEELPQPPSAEFLARISNTVDSDIEMIESTLQGSLPCGRAFSSLYKAFYDDDNFEMGGAEPLDTVAARIVVEVACERAARARHLDNPGSLARVQRDMVHRIRDVLALHKHQAAPEPTPASKQTSNLADSIPDIDQVATVYVTGEPQCHDYQDANIASQIPVPERELGIKPTPLQPSVEQLESYLRSGVLAEMLVRETTDSIVTSDVSATTHQAGNSLAGGTQEENLTQASLISGGVVQWFIDHGEHIEPSQVRDAAREVVTDAVRSLPQTQENELEESSKQLEEAWDLETNMRPWSDENILSLVTNLVLAQLSSTNQASAEASENAESTQKSKGSPRDSLEIASNAALASRLAAEAAERGFKSREEDVRSRERELVEHEQRLALREAEARTLAAQTELRLKEESLSRLASESSTRQELLIEQERQRAANLEAALDKFGSLQMQTLTVALDRMQSLFTTQQQQQQQQQFQQDSLATRLMLTQGHDVSPSSVHHVVSLATQTEDGDLEASTTEQMRSVVSLAVETVYEEATTDIHLEETKTDAQALWTDVASQIESKTTGLEDTDTASTHSASNRPSIPNNDRSDAEDSIGERSHDLDQSQYAEGKDLSALDISAVHEPPSPEAESVGTSFTLVLPKAHARQHGGVRSFMTPALEQESNKATSSKGFQATLLEWSSSDEDDDDNDGGASHDSRSLSEGELDVAAGDFSDGEEVPLTMAYRSALQPAVTGAPWEAGKMPNIETLYSKNVSVPSSPGAESVSSLSSG